MEHRKDRLHGIMAEFEDPQDLIAAIRSAREQGYRKMDAYTPYPIEEVWHELGHTYSVLPWMVLVGGLIGFFGGFFLQYWVSAIAYPINVGGRPFNSWPAFMPVSFECTILLSALTAVLGMLALNGLPHPHHPVFNVERFVHASRDRYFLAIEATDGRFEREGTAAFLWSLKPAHVAEIADS